MISTVNAVIGDQQLDTASEGLTEWLTDIPEEPFDDQDEIDRLIREVEG